MGRRKSERKPDEVQAAIRAVGSRELLAVTLGVSLRTISYWLSGEHGVTKPYADAIEELMEALGSEKGAPQAPLPSSSHPSHRKDDDGSG